MGGRKQKSIQGFLGRQLEQVLEPQGWWLALLYSFPHLSRSPTHSVGEFCPSGEVEAALGAGRQPWLLDQHHEVERDLSTFMAPSLRSSNMYHRGDKRAGRPREKGSQIGRQGCFSPAKHKKVLLRSTVSQNSIAVPLPPACGGGLSFIEFHCCIQECMPTPAPSEGWGERASRVGRLRVRNPISQDGG